jgi:transmembrane sensor
VAERLPDPIREVLDVPVDELTIQRIWAKTRRARNRNDEPRSAPARWPLTVGAAAVLGIGAAVLAWVDGQDAGPLADTTGTSVGGFARGTTRLSDGSSVAVAEDAALDVLGNDSHAVSLLLRSGTASFDIEPGGPRRWSIECGLVTVEVIGTELTIERREATSTSPEEVRVAVARGVVLLRGDRVPDRVRRLTAGEELIVQGEQSPAVAAAPSLSDASSSDGPTEEHTEDRSAGHSVVADVAAPMPETTGVAWQSLADQGEYVRAYDLLGREGVSREVTSAGVDELMALADVARLSGHPDEAIGPLERILELHSASSQAPFAAFILGRIHLDHRRDPVAAAFAFEQALEAGLPEDLARAAQAHLAVARGRAGDVVGAGAAAGEYRGRFGEGAARFDDDPPAPPR